jgi:c-di-GMP-binding flagellar brake protein YcgR
MGQWRRTSTALQKFPRTATRVCVRVSTVDSEYDPTSGQRFFRSLEETTANLSRGGAFVRSAEPLVTGRRVVMSFDLSPRQDGSDELELLGRVVWTRRIARRIEGRTSRTPGYGVEFMGVTREETTRLERFLASLERAKSGREQVSAVRQPAMRAATLSSARILGADS